jgi:predicted RNase H-like nuclease (RuvC/YqgF family)
MADVNNLRDEDDDDILYGDLEDTGRSADFEKLSKKVVDLTKKNEQLQAELNETKQQLNVLLEEKAIVEKNMMVLYNTALREIDRKDKQIAQLQRPGLVPVSTPGAIGTTSLSSSSSHSAKAAGNT